MSRALGGARVTSRSRMRIAPLVTASRPATIRQRRRLATSGRTDNDHELALVDVQRELRDHHGGAVRLHDVVDLDPRQGVLPDPARTQSAPKRQCLDVSDQVHRIMANRIGRSTNPGSRDRSPGVSSSVQPEARTTPGNGHSRCAGSRRVSPFGPEDMTELRTGDGSGNAPACEATTVPASRSANDMFPATMGASSGRRPSSREGGTGRVVDTTLADRARARLAPRSDPVTALGTMSGEESGQDRSTPGRISI